MHISKRILTTPSCDCPFLRLDKIMRQEIYLTSGEREGEVVNLKCVASKGVHHVTAAEVFVEISQSIVQNSKRSQDCGFTTRA